MPDENLITSRENERLIAVRKVRDGKDRTRCFIEGVRLANEALRSAIAIEACFISGSFEQIGQFADLKDRTVVVADNIFSTITDTKNPQGIVLIARRPAASLETIAGSLEDSSPNVLYLHEINNPSNIGAIFRTAEAAGAAGIIVSPGSVDAFSPKSLRAAMGSAFRVPCVTNIRLFDAVDWAGGLGCVTSAADISGSRDYLQIDWTKPRLLVLGSEAHGLPKEAISLIDETISIGMSSGIESLNIAVSTGIMLFEARRQLLSV